MNHGKRAPRYLALLGEIKDLEDQLLDYVITGNKRCMQMRNTSHKILTLD